MKKFQYITQNKLGAPISLAYGEQGKYSRAEDSPMAVDPIGDGGEPVGFRQQHGRQHLRDHEDDNCACPNLRAQSKTHFFHSEITTP